VLVHGPFHQAKYRPKTADTQEKENVDTYPVMMYSCIMADVDQAGNEIGSAVKALRTALGLSQGKFAALLECGLATVQRWENSEFKVSPAGLVKLYRVARDADQHGLAAVFVRGHRVLPGGLPTIPVAIQALPILDDFFGDSIPRLTQVLFDHRLSDDKRRSLLSEVLEYQVQGRRFIAGVLAEVQAEPEREV
jgi:DNA-binding transcriptional regulator YiaG